MNKTLQLTEEQKKELSSSIQGDAYFDKLARKLYSTAACIYQIEPAGVIYPRHTDDVVKTVLWAKKYSIPITARGTGSGLAGQSVGEGIIMDFSRYMNRILEISLEKSFVRLQPGVVFGKLSQLLAKKRLFFPPDPASGDYCTIGGMLGNNSSGAHSVKYGATKDYVMELQVVLDNGEIIKISSPDFDLLPLTNPGETLPSSQQAEGGLSITSKRYKEIYDNTFEILKTNRNLVEKNTPHVLKNSSGYNLKETLRGDTVDLTRLITGSEGTLGIITEAVIKLMPLPDYKSTALLFFDDLHKLGQVVNLILPLGPSAIEMMDKGLIDLVRGHRPDVASLFPKDIEASLLIEFEGNSSEQIKERMEESQKAVKDYLSWDMKISDDPLEQEKLWRVRRAATPLLNSREDGERRPVVFIEDVSVHPAKFPEYILKLRKILSQNGLDAIIYGHAGDGNVHVRPLLNLKDASDIEIMKKVAGEVYKMAFNLGGTLSGEHGDGMLRAAYFQELYGPLYDVMKKIKEIFDPAGIFNPGKIISATTIDKNLRLGPSFRWVEEKYPMKEHDLLLSLARCHGCGMCRSFCPVYKAVGKEIATPRAKANWIREMVRGKISPGESFESPLAEEILCLCFNCHTCTLECPTGVDGSLLSRSAKFFLRDYLKLNISDILFENPEVLAKSGVIASPLSNLIIKNSFIRTIMSSLAGIARKREVPEFQRIALKRQTLGFGGTETVVYFPGCYEKYYAPGQGKAIVDVLNYNGYNVEIAETVCCGMPKISSGNWDEAGINIISNIKKLFPFASGGMTIVTGCPSCGLALKKDYPYILKNFMAKTVSEHVMDIHEFLLLLHDKGKFNLKLADQHKSFIYHAPCHLKAQGAGNMPLELLRLIPGLLLSGTSKSCCGIAGSYGMKEKNYKISENIAKETFRELLDIRRDLAVTSCGTCRIQIGQLLGGEVLHPLEILAESYRGEY